MRVEVINEYVDAESRERIHKGASFDTSTDKGRRLINQGLAKEVQAEPKRQAPAKSKKSKPAQE